MGWTLHFFTLFYYFSGIRSQPTLTQPPFQSVSPGQTVQLPCTARGSVGHTHWLQQRLGQGPRFALYGASTRGEGIPNRFTGSKSGDVHYLVIANVQAEDEADYYCCSWDGSGSQFHSSEL
uniref:Uncharacterized protein n=1 Tax=Sphaerodactylus townsendi TaxID=933632 RepID=A0ACB8FYT4_9SAUR